MCKFCKRVQANSSCHVGRFDSKFQEAVDGMKELNMLISSSEMDHQTHGSSPAGSDISVDTINEELEVCRC